MFCPYPFPLTSIDAPQATKTLGTMRSTPLGVAEFEVTVAVLTTIRRLKVCWPMIISLPPVTMTVLPSLDVSVAEIVAFVLNVTFKGELARIVSEVE